MTGKEPFYYHRVIAHVVIAIFQEETPDPSLYPALPSEDGLWDLMRKCWDPNPGQRSPIPQIINKINILMDSGNDSTGRSVIPQSDGNSMLVPPPPTEESIIQPGIKVSKLLPPLSGEVKRIKYIGGGRSGDTYQGFWTPPGKDQVLVAIKGIKDDSKYQAIDGRAHEIFVEMVKRETVIWKATENHNILEFYGYCIVDEKPLLVSPWYQRGNLWSYLGEHSRLTEIEKLNMVRDVARGLAYLHSLEPPIAHGGIKPQNILISDNLDSGSGLTGPVSFVVGGGGSADSLRRKAIATSASALPHSEMSVVQPGTPLPPLPEPLLGDLETVETVGRGGYGVVYRGYWTPAGNAPLPVAIKRLNIGDIGSGQDQNSGILTRV
ncbi:hypothetical protein FRC00_000829 [Tulasnella sp. 408]|nr:hypothetical protein FRC00_000829 [Tulasnella sp. 408]